ncbi:MAG: secondary thiamine-phosphate synthase enzyme YjbQ [Candidatus Pacebacteria bacterium]|nr:secondary thiamine-phosphate synthase enzyme YjbQ [Candidatus Paceibacterota bacterium]NUQ56958.1 YjbQ family protein [Candidatus Paceibacter sp.]
MQTLKIKTKRKKEIVDITKEVEIILPVDIGLCNIFVKHTTAALAVADLDPGTDSDMLDAFEQMVPKLQYRHLHDPSHVKDHIMASVVGQSVSLPVSGGKFLLGQWQKLVLVELDGPRERELLVTFVEETF